MTRIFGEGEGSEGAFPEPEESTALIAEVNLLVTGLNEQEDIAVLEEVQQNLLYLWESNKASGHVIAAINEVKRRIQEVRGLERGVHLNRTSSQLIEDAKQTTDPEKLRVYYEFAQYQADLDPYNQAWRTAYHTIRIIFRDVTRTALMPEREQVTFGERQALDRKFLSIVGIKAPEA